MRAIALAAALFLLAVSASSGSATLTGGGYGKVLSISCSAPGDCAAGGFHREGSYREAFVVSETNGSWGNAMNVPGMVRLSGGGGSRLDSISCAAPGDCVAGGYARLDPYRAAFVAGETNGRWGDAIEVPGIAALKEYEAGVTSISCAAAGECAAGGWYVAGPPHPEEAFVAGETNGRWGKAIEVPGIATLNTGRDALVDSISCGAVGDCAAGGYYTGHGGYERAFVVTERNGRWGNAIEVPGTSTRRGGRAVVSSISCASAGACAAGGYSNAHAFVVSETNGRWGKAMALRGAATLDTAGRAAVISISCAAAGECAAGGSYRQGSRREAFVVSETNGSWGDAVTLPGLPTLNTGGHAGVASISCPAPGECAAGGFYDDGSGGRQAFVADETNGSWGNAVEVRGLATLNPGRFAGVGSISCATAGECAAGGSVTPRAAPRRSWAFVVGETNGSWTNAMHLRNFPASCVVPYVVGKAIGVAKKRLSAAGCGLGTITYVYSNVQRGRVLAQQRTPGRVLNAGTRVALTVSKGKTP